MYFDRLPKWAQVPGDICSGEIEVLAPGEEKGFGVVYEDRYVLVVRDKVRFPNGAVGSYLRIFERPGLDGAPGAVMVPVSAGQILMVRVFRHATRRWELELPRGFRESGDSPEETVARELVEELGVEVEGVEKLGEVTPNTGLMASVIPVYLVQVSTHQLREPHDPREAISGGIALSASEVLSKIRSGEIRDGFSLSAFMLASASNRLFRN